MAIATVQTTADLSARLAAALPNGRRPQVMHHGWESLLFLHWRCVPSDIQKTLPPRLTVDTFEDEAFIGITPFFMRNIRPVGVPAFLWFSFSRSLTSAPMRSITPGGPVFGFTRSIVTALSLFWARVS